MDINIRNEQHLKKYLNDTAEYVIKRVSEKILWTLRENIIKYTYTYEYYPNLYYYDQSRKPTFQFYNAWKWDVLKKDINSITRELFYDYASMQTNPDNWLHGSPIDGDAREGLAAILNELVYKGRYTSSLMVSQVVGHSMHGKDRPFSKARKRYWDITIKELFTQKKITSWFDEELRWLGFQKF